MLDQRVLEKEPELIQYQLQKHKQNKNKTQSHLRTQNTVSDTYQSLRKYLKILNLSKKMKDGDLILPFHFMQPCIKKIWVTHSRKEYHLWNILKSLGYNCVQNPV